MIVSRNRKLVFCHIPKTGGGAVSRALRDNDSQCEKVFDTHSSIHFLPKEFRGFHKFTLVRNPFTIYPSLYWFRYNIKRAEMDSTWFIEGDDPGFKDFLRICFDKGFLNKQHAYVYENGHKLVDEILKFEDFPSNFGQMCTRLGLNNVIPTKDRTTHYYGERDDKVYYDKEAIKLIEDNCKEDLEMFGYSYPWEK